MQSSVSGASCYFWNCTRIASVNFEISFLQGVGYVAYTQQYTALWPVTLMNCQLNNVLDNAGWSATVRMNVWRDADRMI